MGSLESTTTLQLLPITRPLETESNEKLAILFRETRDQQYFNLLYARLYPCLLKNRIWSCEARGLFNFLDFHADRDEIINNAFRDFYLYLLSNRPLTNVKSWLISETLFSIRECWQEINALRRGGSGKHNNHRPRARHSVNLEYLSPHSATCRNSTENISCETDNNFTDRRETNPLDDLLRQERIELVQKAIAQLTPHEQEIIHLVTRQGYGQRKLGEHFQIPASTAWSHYLSALKKLHDILENVLSKANL